MSGVSLSPSHPGPAPAALRLDDATLRVGDRTLWSGLNVQVRPGEFLAVLGANGSGKTSLLRAILGLAPLTSGTVLIDGRPPRRGGDGIACDTAGRVYVAAGFNLANPPLESADVKAGIHIFAPDGKSAGFIPVPIDMVTNCCFGGADYKTLYITAGHMLFSVPVETAGFEAWPKVAK